MNADVAYERLPQRREAVATFLACGDEIEFWRKVQRKDAGEAILPFIIGKMLWLILHTGVEPPPPTTPTTPTTPTDPRDRLGMSDDEGRVILVQRRDRQSATGGSPTACVFTATGQNFGDLLPADTSMADLNKAMSRTDKQDNEPDAGYGDACPIIISSSDRGKSEISYIVSPQCMRRQINFALMRMSVTGQLGSSDLPCHFLGPATEGEWDVSVRDLIRIFYMNSLHSSGRLHLLDPPTVKHIQERLLTVDGSPGLTSYSLFQCGNQEESTGSAEDRAAERSWTDDTDVDDWAAWFALRILLIIALIVAGALLALAGVLAPLVVALLAVAGTAIVFLRIPETENHLLMIETSRYLNNQIIIDDLNAKQNDTSKYDSDQQKIKEFLLDKFQSILKKDFDEFNSRNYTRYSVNAILNLAEFARDPDLTRASRAVLDYVTAKIAVSSNLGRRLPPFRRKMKAIHKKMEADLFDIVELGDHSVAYLLFYTGQTQQMDNVLPAGLVEQMAQHAASSFGCCAPGHFAPVPEPLIIDLAIDKLTPYDQAYKHAGIEIYSSGDGWLVTAGGVQTGPANFVFAPVTPTFAKDDDRGAAWPTTLMLTAGAHKTHLHDFIRIDGVKITHKKFLLNDEDFETFDGNICVGAGFACGFNLRIPEHIHPSGGLFPGCSVPAPGRNPDERWRFFDTDTCEDYKAGPRAFVAIFRERCPRDIKGCDNFGFFEAVSATDSAFNGVPERNRFRAFMDRVLADNPRASAGLGALDNPQSPMVMVLAEGSYVSAKGPKGQGSRIEFKGSLSANPSGAFEAASEIKSIGGKKQERSKLAQGDVVVADSDGKVEIFNRKRGQSLLLDLTNKDKPVRQVK